MSEKPIEIKYIFKFGDGTVTVCDIRLDPRTLHCLMPDAVPPDWAKLSYYQCDNCPLDESTNEHCPIAVNIGHLVEAFKDVGGYETAHVLVMTQQRDVSKTTTIRDGLSSLLGIYMVTSGCPVMAKLKPLVRYHLPFANIEESVIRVASIYLLIQYFLMKKGMQPDWELEKLERIYEHIAIVNAGFARRIRNAAAKDASLIALENLDYMASLVPFVITDTLSEIEQSLDSYWRE